MKLNLINHLRICSLILLSFSFTVIIGQSIPFQKEYYISGIGVNTEGLDVIKNPQSNGFLLLGGQAGSSTLLHVDNLGAIVDQKALSTGRYNNIENLGNKHFIAGTSYIIPLTPTNEMQLNTISGSINTIDWQKKTNIQGNGYNTLVSSVADVIINSNNEYVVLSNNLENYYFPNSNNYVNISIYNSSGQLLKTRTYESFLSFSSIGRFVVTKIIQNSFGNYIIVGTTRMGTNDNDITIGWLDPNLNPLSTFTCYDMTGNDDQGVDVTEATISGSKSLLITGTSLVNSSTAGRKTVLLAIKAFEIAGGGSTLWSVQLNSTNNQHTYAADAIITAATSKTDLLICGYSRNKTTAVERAFLLDVGINTTSAPTSPAWIKQYSPTKNSKVNRIDYNDISGYSMIGTTEGITGKSAFKKSIYFVNTDASGSSYGTCETAPSIAFTSVSFTKRFMTNTIHNPYLIANNTDAFSSINHIAQNPCSPCTLAVSLSASSLSYCGQNITISSNLTGSGYYFSWSNGQMGYGIDQITVTGPGTYTVSVNDANGCVGTATIVIGSSSFNVSASFAPTCIFPNGPASYAPPTQLGNINVTVTGGTGPYTYSYMDPTSFYVYQTNTSSSSTDSYLSNVNGGLAVLVTDANGCTSTIPIVPTNTSLYLQFDATTGACSPSAPINSIGGGAISFSSTTNPAVPTSGFVYTWAPVSMGASVPSSQVNMALPTGLTVGDYNVTIQGCYGTPPINPTSCSTDPSCEITFFVTVKPGTKNTTYSYATSPANPCEVRVTFNSTFGVSSISPNNTNFTWGVYASPYTPGDPLLFPLQSGTGAGTASTYFDFAANGNYVLMVNYVDYDCQEMVNFTINSINPLNVFELYHNNIACIAPTPGNIAVDAMGGAGGPYTFAWDFPGGASGVYTDAYGATINNLTTTGNYYVEVTDAVGCKQVYGPINLLAANTLALTSSTTGCNGTVNLTSTNAGAGPFTYVWAQQQTIVTATTPTTTVTQLTPWFTETTNNLTSTASNLPPGTYVVTVTDKNGCTTTANVIIAKPSGPKNVQICWTIDPLPTEPEGPPTSTALDDEAEEWAKDVTNALNDQFNGCYDNGELAKKEMLRDKCLTASNFIDNLELSYPVKQKHYTLYYYDRNGNLVKTVPPQGLETTNLNTRFDQEDHDYKTTYDYNSLGQLIKQNTPDGGTTEFINNSLGQLRFSQNAKQAANNKFSYTKYDELGRVAEVGESNISGPFSALAANADVTYPIATSAIYPTTGNNQRTYTTYNDPVSGIDYFGQEQRYLQNRVSSTYNDYGVTTYYSYDPHGNVEWLIQDIPEFGKNYIRYEYDLISNKVKKVIYNEFRSDRFYHRYSYNEDNQITNVETSADGVVWDSDSRYKYGMTGALSRHEIGEDNVQGLDYNYTVNGWLKAINSVELNPANPYYCVAGWDPSVDGYLNGPGPACFGSINQNLVYGRDVFGMAMRYYQGDYIINGSVFGNYLDNDLSQVPTTAYDLYNGNIAGITTALDRRANGAVSSTDAFNMIGETYKYDQLNRLKISEYKAGTGSLATFESFNSSGFSTLYDYDANGNITNLKRYNNASTPTLFDNINYTYNTISAGKPNNQLGSIVDAGSGTSATEIQGTSAYTYDDIGNIIADSKEELSAIEWDVYGKIKKIEPLYNTNPSLQKPRIIFKYDAAGNRVVKEVNSKPYNGSSTPYTDPAFVTTTYYSRDAQGNIMAIYERKNTLVSGSTYDANYKLIEQPIYGSERVGMRKLTSTHPAYAVGTVAYNTSSGPAPKLDDNTFNGLVVKSENNNILAGLTKTGGGLQLRNLDINAGLTLSGTGITSSTFGRGIVAAEDDNGKLLFSAAVLANYSSSTDRLLVYDASFAVMPGTGSIFADANTKPQIVKVPGNNNKYYIFTRAKTTGYLQYTIVDMSLLGNGTTPNVLGDVESGSSAVTLTNYKVGSNFAVLQSGVNGINSRLFVTKHTAGSPSGTKDIFAFEITEQNGITGPVSFTAATGISSNDAEGGGELAISKDGKYLALYNFDGTQFGPFSVYTAPSIKVYNLDKQFNLTSLFVSINPGTSSSMANSSLEFSNKTNLLYFTKFDGTSTGNAIIKYDLTALTGGALATGVHGNLKRANNNKVYLAQDSKHLLGVIDETTSTPAFTPISQNITASPNYNLIDVLGQRQHRLLWANLQPEAKYDRYVTYKNYEIKDHLSNVRAVVSDRKLSNIRAEVLAYNNYLPFGMPMPDAKFNFNAPDYRYGYNGKENDNEVKGTSNQQDYGLRVYDPRLGKFLSIDPLAKKFAWNSPYSFAENDVIRAIDLDGGEKNFVYRFEVKGKALTHTVPYSVVHPGEDHGPLGTGDYVMTQDPKTKQFSGGYFKSYADVNPIRSRIQDIDQSYKGEKGFKKRGLPTLIALSGVLTGGASLAVESAAAGGILAISNTQKALLLLDATGVANDIDKAFGSDTEGFLPQWAETTLSFILLTQGVNAVITDIGTYEGALKNTEKISKELLDEKTITGSNGVIADEADFLQNVSEQNEVDNEKKKE